MLLLLLQNDYYNYEYLTAAVALPHYLILIKNEGKFDDDNLFVKQTNKLLKILFVLV